MSLIAGIYSWKPEERVLEPLKKEILRGLSRDVGSRAQVFEHGRVWTVKVDLGIFPEPGVFQAPDGSFSLLCGEPLLGEAGHERGGGREQDVADLHRILSGGGYQVLRETRGVFSMAHAPHDGSRLVLVADHLAIRPLYVLQQPDFVFFSSRLSLLRDLTRPELDPRGAIEFAQFGYSLGKRTPLKGVARLEPAEVLEVGPGRDLQSMHYWDWCTEVPVSQDLPKIPDEDVYEEFRQGIRLRLRSDHVTAAYLSGGLDSRAIVSVLRDLSVQVLTLNFSVPGAQDEVLSRLFSSAAKTFHAFVPLTDPVSLWQGDWSFLFRKAWNELDGQQKEEVQRPGLVWSGDGGSVGVGGALMFDHIAEQMLAGDLGKAAQAIAGSPPRRIIRQERLADLETIPLRGVQEALEAIDHPDPLRRYMVFLLFNDQRCHLDGHFETLDLHRLEFHLPFFDFAFMKKVMLIPMERLRKHRFYHEWLQCFPAVAFSLPWQTYPGHLPCPLPLPSDVPDQWSGAGLLHSQRFLSRGARRTRREQLASMAFSDAFPKQVIDRKRLLAAGLLHQLGIRDYDGVIEFAFRLFWHSLGRCSGHVSAKLDRHNPNR